MAPSFPSAQMVGCAALLALAVCRCGLSAQGQGALQGADGGKVSGSSSGYGSSGGQGGSSSGTSSSSGASSGGADDGGAQMSGDDGSTFTLPSPDAALDDARRADAGPKDAAGDASSVCAQLNTCCGLLGSYGVSASSVQSCLQAAAGNDEATCATVLATFESVLLCL